MLSIKKLFAYLHPGKSYPSTNISTVSQGKDLGNQRSIASTSQKLLGLHLFLVDSLKPELCQTLDRITHEQAVRSAEVRKQKQEEKYKKTSPQAGSPLPTHTIKNLSSHVLSEVSVLSKEHNFAVTPTSIFTEEIINQIETAIFRLPPEASNDIRQQAVNILRKVKPLSQNISREERLVLRNLRQNNNILILPANKENATVVIDKEDYCNKVNAMLSDYSVCRKLKQNPTTTIKKKTFVLVKNSGLSPETTKYLTPREFNIGGPSYQLARYLTKPLQKLTGLNGSHIKNSIDFVNKIAKIKTKLNDLLVSFNVLLFTNVPVQDTLDIIIKSDKLPANLFPLIEHCLTSIYFQFQGEFFEQTSGAAMEFSISPIIANIFMEHLEDKVLKNTPFKPPTWFRYVDDTFVI
ncbi:uncharacterized protein LOC113004947 [Solenopsis invicta]|uniref:uncharacterized protein LOC113004947 n=1 Tax=Solenopsis invicta TaxID=13686 RepID=UPI00193DE6A2|nr:uncharacterized protein LOC113004947 [Solenopsis invicta]